MKRRIGVGKIEYTRRKFYILSLGLTLYLLVQCNPPSETERTEAPKNDVISDSITSNSLLSEMSTINYHLVATKDTINWLKSLVPGDTLNAILVLNRIDKANFDRTDTLVFPDSFEVGIDLYCPFPKTVEQLKDVHKIILVSHYAQVFAAYENGVRIKWGPTSTGKASTPTPKGLFAVNWKSKRTVSTVDPTWIMDWYFNLDNFRGVSVHQYALPGYPASHSCVRLYKEDAIWLYHWIDQWQLEKGEISVYGTPVIIFGDYPFDQRKPWFKLAENNAVMDITPENLIGVLAEFLPTIMERQVKRDSIEIADSLKNGGALIN